MTCHSSCISTPILEESLNPCLISSQHPNEVNCRGSSRPIATCRLLHVRMSCFCKLPKCNPNCLAIAVAFHPKYLVCILRRTPQCWAGPRPLQDFEPHWMHHPCNKSLQSSPGLNIYPRTLNPKLNTNPGGKNLSWSLWMVGIIVLRDGYFSHMSRYLPLIYVNSEIPSDIGIPSWKSRIQEFRSSYLQMWNEFTAHP